MKIIDKFIRVGLIAMILLSLFLSWKILNNSDNKQVSKKQNQSSKNVTSLKQPTDVFLPVKLVYYNAEGKQLYSNKESLLQQLLRQLIDNSSNGAVGNQKTVNIINLKEAFDLSMSDDMPLNYFLAINKHDSASKVDKNLMFRRLVVAVGEPILYFLDNNNKEVYQMKLNFNTTDLKILLNDSDNRYIEVGNNQSDAPVYYEFTEPLHLPKYSYILATQSYSVFSNSFFEKGQELVSENDDLNNRDIKLSNSQGESLAIKYETGEVNYNGHLASKANNQFKSNTMLEESFYYLQNIGNSLGTLRFYEADENQVIYRNYVEGYPVFSDGVRGRFEFAKKDNTVQIKTNQETIQVPIPSKEEVVLPSTREVINQLANYGIEESEIKGMQIGYSWINNQETKQVIDLTPEWYIKLTDEWISLNQVETQESQGESN